MKRSIFSGFAFLSMLAATCISFAGAEPVQYREDALTLPTYPWNEDPNPVVRAYENAIYYPYTRQEHISKTSAPRTYRTLVLENEYLRVTCIPELGGRIHSVYVKATGKEMFHRNDVIKPALIAMRGAWISGGIEWNAGPHGHTVTVVSPVDALIRDNGDGSATLVVGNTEKMFRTRWTVELTLHPGRALLDETIRMYNPTDTAAPYYFWNCTAFPNLEGTRFIYPMTLGTDHNGTSFYRWPIHEGEDLSYLKNYETMSSIFGYKCDFDFFGAYDVNLDQGIVSYANHHELPGKKAWTWGKDDFGVVSQMSLSDAGPVHAQYIEVQSGPLLTQSDYGMLKPGREIRWREYWYPVHGLGDGFEYANRDIVAQTHRENGVLRLGLLATAAYPGARCLVSRETETLLDTAIGLDPAKALALEIPNAGDGPVTITVSNADGAVLLQYVSPLDIPVVEPPDLAEHPAREDGKPAADELYAKASLLHSQTEPDKARDAYLAVLAEDPLHAPALCGLAALALQRADWAGARDYAVKAVQRDPGNADGWYALGVAEIHLGDLTAAKNSSYKAAFTPDKDARGFYLAGRIEMLMGNYQEALRLFKLAEQGNGFDAAARNGKLAALLALGDTAEVTRLAEEAIKQDPTDFTLDALNALAAGTCDAYVKNVDNDCGETEFTLQETACFLFDLGLYKQAAPMLEAGLHQGMDGPVTRVYAAWCHHSLSNEAAALEHLGRAATVVKDDALPARPEDIPIFEYAVAALPETGRFNLLLGTLYAHFGRLDDAVTQWRAAVEKDASLGIAWRLLALDAWKKRETLGEAEDCLRKALAVRPEDQVLYRDLAQVLEKQGKRVEAIALVESMPEVADVRYDVCLWLAQAYVDEKRYDDCIALLETARFSNWEGQTTPRDIFVTALMARGKRSFEANDMAAALQDFERALTYPENLEVGRPYVVTNAETHYWIGKTLQALERIPEAREAFTTGAAQRSSDDPPLPFVTVTPAQDEHVRKCRAALEVL
jgi:tetratricopeptide (TPR) repeat protein